MTFLRNIFTALSLTAAGCAALAAEPQLAFLPDGDGAPDVFKVSQVDRITFSRGNVSLALADGVRSFPTASLKKVVFDSDGLYSAIDNIAADAPRKGAVTPNPVADYFTVDVDSPTPLSVFTITGSRVIHISDYRGGQVNATSLPQGIYIVKTRNITAKFIKL